MDVEIDYNPYIPRTSLKINGNPSDNIYGALFPVRRYVMQTWLSKNGAWRGLGKALGDIARERRFTLIFRGRNMDYGDVVHALGGIDAELVHIPAYESREEKSFIDETVRKLSLLEAYPNREIAEKAKAILGSRPEAGTGRVFGAGEADSLREALKTSRGLVMIEADFFSELEKTIQKCLYGSFIRPAGSVAVIAGHRAEAEKYAYAREYGINVMCCGDGAIEALREKYSVPEVIGKEYQMLRHLAELIGELFERREALRRRNRLIRDSDSESSDKEYAGNADEIRWIQRNEAVLGESAASILARTEEV